jgi:hypothetical protein
MVIQTVESKKSYGQLIEEMESLKGYKIIQEIELLKGTNYIFTLNYFELKDRINLFEKDYEIWFVKNRQNIYYTNIETLRLLHNYSSSVLTLIDHTRNFRKKIREKNLEKIFENEISRLNVNDVAVFMKLIRQYLQHYSLPIINSNFNIKMAEFTENQYISNSNGFEEWSNDEIINDEGTENPYVVEIKMELDVNKLLEWKRWDSRSKKYLQKYGKSVEIKVFCEEYFKLIESFYDSFYKIVLEAYKNEIMELENFKQYVAKVYPRTAQK